MEKEKLKKVTETEEKSKRESGRETQKQKQKREELQRNAIIGYKMKQLRMSNSFTQTEVADMLNVSPQHYGTLERGVNSFTLENLISLCSLYKVPLVSVIGDINANEQKCGNSMDKLFTSISSLNKEHKGMIEYMVKYLDALEKEGVQERQGKTDKLIQKELARIEEKEQDNKEILIAQNLRRKTIIRKKK